MKCLENQCFEEELKKRGIDTVDENTSIGRNQYVKLNQKLVSQEYDINMIRKTVLEWGPIQRYNNKVQLEKDGKIDNRIVF
jgi:hypothetical protein